MMEPKHSAVGPLADPMAEQMAEPMAALDHTGQDHTPHAAALTDQPGEHHAPAGPPGTALPGADQPSPAINQAIDKSAFIAHELRTPLSAMLSLTDLLSATELDERQSHYVRSLKGAATGLLAVLNDILDHAKLEAGAMELATEPFDPSALLLELETLFSAACAQKNLTLNHMLPGTPPGAVMGDPHRLRQILTNLVNNAVKFTETGTITLKLDIEILDESRIRQIFTVQDTGCGITPEIQARLFKPFAQADAGIANKYGGTGLGLAISAKLAALMGGEIGCQSDPGHGSRFWLSMETAPATAEELARHAGQRQAANNAGARASAEGLMGTRILVAEDNRINRTLIATYLDRFGCEFEFADNGQMVLDILSRSRFDIILMDIIMPEMNGIEATTKIREMGPPNAALPILALSADNPQEIARKYAGQGFSGFITKPIKPDSLYESLSAVIARHGHASRGPAEHPSPAGVDTPAGASTASPADAPQAGTAAPTAFPTAP